MEREQELLTPKQQEAVKYIDNPLLIVAGPGTGKTTVMVEKVAYLVNKDDPLLPEKILVCTFSNKAANELKKRVRKKIGNKVDKIHISTIHSFCLDMLHKFSEFHNIGSDILIFNELEQLFFIYSKYKEYRVSIDIYPGDLIDLFNKLTENDIDPDKLIDTLKKENREDNEIIIAKTYKRYIKDVLNSGCLDYALIQREFFHLLKQNVFVLNKLREMYDYILIDEYQDTNPIQDKIFRLIIKTNNNITVVGDEDQSIYGFRGASIENFQLFKERYPQAELKSLERNFRSHSEIVEVFDDFMSGSRTIQKKIYTEKGNYSKPVLITSMSAKKEAEKIADFIENLNKNHGVEYKDITILLKSVKFGSKLIIKEFEKRKPQIPSTVIGEGSLLFKHEITSMLMLMINFTSYCCNENEYNLFFRYLLIDSDFFDIEQETRNKLLYECNDESFFENYNKKKLNRMNICEKDCNTLIKLKQYKKIINKKIPISVLFQNILDITNYDMRLTNRVVLEDSKARIILTNLGKFSQIISKFEKHSTTSNIIAFLDYLKNTPEYKLGDSANLEEENSVNVMTIHQAKGLEFPVVIMAGVTAKRYYLGLNQEKHLIEIPIELLLNKRDSDIKRELERVFYVGISRAEKLLAISTYENNRNKPSIFIEEIGKDKFIRPNEFNKHFNKGDHFKKKDKDEILSFSKINSYITCPYLYFLTKIANFDLGNYQKFEYGRIVHDCLKKLNLMIKNNNDINEKILSGIVDSTNLDKKDELLQKLKKYYAYFKENYKEVIEVELPFTLSDSGIIIKGKIDLIVKDSSGKISIIDFKAVQKDHLKYLNTETQLRMYQLALIKNNLQISKIVAFSFEDTESVYYSNSEIELDETRDLIKKVNQSIINYEFSRNFGTRTCNSSTGRCKFFKMCEKCEKK